ncbi:MAG: PilT/PilU family type 4a pilus ATPase [Candidatus Omnitrophota bacterium]
MTGRDVTHMGTKEERVERRYRTGLHIHYEKILNDGNVMPAISVPARDISESGISFYSAEKVELHSKLRISFSVDQEEIVFSGTVVRAEICKDGPFAFFTGIQITDIDKINRARINQFIARLDISHVLDGINMAEVVDIHFVAGYPPIIKKIGGLTVEKSPVLGEEVLRDLLLNTLDDERYNEFISQKEVNFVLVHKEGKRFRINLHIQRDKVEGVFRLIPSQINLPHQLGLPESVEKLVLKDKKGLILVAGRTGAGKSTTLAGMVELLNTKREAIVISIEKPIEYIHTNKKCIIKQREVGRDTLSFSNAAKNALRQNPDVLVIGEILDEETMDVAITAAETGMLVLSSMHAPDSAQALDRIASFFPAEMQKHILTRLSLILKGIITQDLIPRIDDKGLVVACEVLIANDAMRRIVRDADWKQIPTIVQTGRDAGMQSMRVSLEEYFNKGLIDLAYLKEYV